MNEYPNPLELAKAKLGEQFDAPKRGPFTDADYELIKGLHIEARDNGFIDTVYWAETEQGLVMPVSTPAKTKEYYGKLRTLDDIAFAGSFIGYNKFSLGSLVSWCLRFNDSILARRQDIMAADEELWVPTVALQTIDVL